MNKIIVEVGSTCTKIDKYDGVSVERIEETLIEFKNHYAKENKLDEKDIKKLIDKINDLKEITSDIYVCGTSIFRTIPDNQKQEFLNRFKAETNIDFIVITPDKENEYTVLGATKNTKGRVAVYVGGGRIN